MVDEKWIAVKIIIVLRLQFKPHECSVNETCGIYMSLEKARVPRIFSCNGCMLVQNKTILILPY